MINNHGSNVNSIIFRTGSLLSLNMRNSKNISGSFQSLNQDVRYETPSYRNIVLYSKDIPFYHGHVKRVSVEKHLGRNYECNGNYSDN